MNTMNRKQKKYSGVIVPAVTPLTADYRLDLQAVQNIFHFFSRNNVHPFILGTTGEAASLPWSLKKEYITHSGRLKSPGHLLYAGISSNCFDECVSLGRHCADAGVDVVVATLPSYYALNTEQVKNFYTQLADALPLPLIIYNIPSTTHMSIPLPVIDELSHHDHIVGIKDSERGEERLTQSLALWGARDDFSYFLGWAAKSAEGLMGGADGLVPSTANLYPALYADLWKAVTGGDHQKAFDLQRLSDLVGDLYQKGRLLGESIAALKVLMKGSGRCASYMMPPLLALTSTEETIIAKEWAQLINKESLNLSNNFLHA